MTRKVKAPETPVEFLKLEPKLQSDRVTKAFLTKCTDTEVFIFSPKANRKVLCKDYYSIKKWLMKNQESLVLLYSYLWSLEEPSKPMDLTTVFLRAQEYNQRLKLANDKEKTKDVREYVDYQEILRKMMEVG